MGLEVGRSVAGLHLDFYLGLLRKGARGRTRPPKYNSFAKTFLPSTKAACYDAQIHSVRSSLLFTYKDQFQGVQTTQSSATDSAHDMLPVKISAAIFQPLCPFDLAYCSRSILSLGILAAVELRFTAVLPLYSVVYVLRRVQITAAVTCGIAVYDEKQCVASSLSDRDNWPLLRIPLRSHLPKQSLREQTREQPRPAHQTELQ